ncbi:MAG: tRNA (adenosine(37)-N6)-threonylcarbamoyltransferase complex transferase subunit TsaD [Dehalococcoidia bacterium]|nr:tRNA (adenosine(37)-N6)-threonylcarbamoyltransferase complex transferase subunit TsaD [Dehalococcoidia bacterium]
MRILAVESSCDETAAAVVVDGRRLLSNVIASQTALHQATGGVVPEVAARAHLRALVPVIRRALADAECGWDDLDAIAATAGPGLPGALVVGLNGARAVAYARGLPFIPVDHIEGHVCANWLSSPLAARAIASGDATSSRAAASTASAATREMDEPPLPALALVVSGGHTELLLMLEHDRFERLGGTRDDAAGEAFDKVARLLGLPYPGGPPLSRLAAQATVRRLRLPRAWLGASDDFSFSGLKTAVLHVVQSAAPPPAAEIAWAFEESVADVLSKKAAHVAAREGVACLLLAGGVAANRRLRERVIERSPVPVFIPPPALCTDNAAMIAAAAFRHLDAAVPAQTPLDIAPTARRRVGRW